MISIKCKHEHKRWVWNENQNCSVKNSIGGTWKISTLVICLLKLRGDVHLRNRKHVLCFYRVIEARVKVWENEKWCGNTTRRRVFPQLFRVLPNFHECFCESIDTQRTCFLFLLENTATQERKLFVYLDLQNVNSLCSRQHYVNNSR